MGAITLISLAVGLVIERGATVVGLAVVAGVLSLAALADGSIRRLRPRAPRSARR